MMASVVDNNEVLNLCRQHLKRVEPAQANLHHSALLVDHNELARLENVETYSSLIKLSASHNQLVRMYGVARLYSLRVLNLSHNSIVSIEGLKDMKHLSSLNLAGNNIKNIEHLSHNMMLELVDLSDNAISTIPDLSYLRQLRKLALHDNRIKTLQFCEKFLPASLTSLTLSDNCLTDLNEVSRLSHLLNIEQFSISGNPSTAGGVCDCRPFIINWLMSLKILDDSLVTPKETLLAEWLYSQGKGRHFKIGQHEELVQYLAAVRPDVCPINGGEESKLDKILNMARQHQQEQQPASSASTVSPVPQRRLTTRKQVSGGAPTSAGRKSREVSKSSARQSLTVERDDPEQQQGPPPPLMHQSLDPSLAHVALERSASANHVSGGGGSGSRLGRPLSTPGKVAAKLSKLPVSLGAPSPSSARRPSSASVVVPSSSGVGTPASASLRGATGGGGVVVVDAEDRAAVTIQKMWRGYRTRNLDSSVRLLKDRLRQDRAEDHIESLTRKLLRAEASNREQRLRLGQLDERVCLDQQRAIDDLQETCRSLQAQVVELQVAVRNLTEASSSSSLPCGAAGASSQPFPRPRSLPLSNKTSSDPAQQPQQPFDHFARSMAHRVVQAASCESDQRQNQC